MRKGKEQWKKRRGLFPCESDRKDKNFIHYTPNFIGSFFVLFSRRVRAFYSKSPFQGYPLLESGCKSRSFSVTKQIYSTIFFNYFWGDSLKRWRRTMLRNIFFKYGWRARKRLERRTLLYYARALTRDMEISMIARGRMIRRIFDLLKRIFPFHFSCSHNMHNNQL